LFEPGFVKICGVTTRADAALVRDSGAHALGVILHRDSKRYVSPEDARAIVSEFRDALSCIVVVKDPIADGLLDAVRLIRPQIVQIHAPITDEVHRALCDLGVNKFIRATRLGDLDRARLEPHHDGLLVDADEPGSGEVADWSSEHLADLTIPVIMAGGLTCDNVAQLISLVGPWGVDVASGTEAAPGVKDAAKVASFVSIAKQAFTEKGLA